MSAADRSRAVTGTAVLDNWAGADWTEGCQIDAVPAFQPVLVITQNSMYEIVVLDPATARLRIRGGQFFPTWQDAQLAGCSLGGSFLKLRGIYAGFRMELHTPQQIVITSPVARLTLAPPQTSAPH